MIQQEIRFLNLLYKDIRTVIETGTIKYNRQAKATETLESKKQSDRFISASMKQDNFGSYIKFEYEALYNAGITDKELIQKYMEDKLLIPYEKRDMVLQCQRQLIINNYEELNNYYRCLNGLPDTDDLYEITIDEKLCFEFGIDPRTPIHKMDDVLITKLENMGYLEELKETFPTRKYLNYLGANRIDILTARNAMPFSIMKFDKYKVSSEFYEDFTRIYEESREYFMSVIYIKDYAERYDMYDNFVAMMIMVMTIQRITAHQFKNAIERDFYDLDVIKLFFEAYNVPFVDKLSVDQYRLITRNLNNLLRYKSTDKVIFDLCEILGFESIEVYKLMLVKEHKLDEHENPIFKYKEVVDDEGGVSLVEDYEAMYELYFKELPIDSVDESTEMLSTTGGTVHYLDITSNDYYWWNDDELLEKIYTSEFNYIETKYMGINMMYQMSKIVFETSYALKMLQDRKDQVNYVMVSIPKIMDSEVNAFNLVTFILALLSKKNGFKGNILIEPTKILSVIGFNFDADFKEIRNFINKNSDTISPSVLRYIENINMRNPQEINNMFNNVRGLHDFLTDKMYKSKEINEYRLYKKLYDTLLISKNMNYMYNMKDKTATTYLEYLHYAEPFLANKLDIASEDEIEQMLEHSVWSLQTLINDIRNLSFINDDVNSLLEPLQILINFFKSYTVDLTTFNIVYLMNDRYLNTIKVIDQLRSINKTIEKESDFKLRYSDFIDTISKTVYESETPFIKDLLYHLKSYLDLSNRNERIELSDLQKMIITELHLISKNLKLEYSDLIELIDKLNILSDVFKTKEEYAIRLSIFGREKQSFTEFIKTIIKEEINDKSLDLKYKDMIHEFNKYMDNINQYLNLTTKHVIYNSLIGDESIGTNHRISFDESFSTNDNSLNLNYADTGSINSKMQKKQSITLGEKFRIF